MDENFLASILGGQQPTFGVPANLGASFTPAPVDNSFGVPGDAINAAMQPPPGTAPAIGDASNVLQALSPPAAAPAPVQPDPTAAPAPAADPAPGQITPDAPRTRHSLLDTLGKISDVIARVGGAAPQYQPTLDAATARANALTDRATAAGDHARQVNLDDLRLALMKNQLATAAQTAGDTSKGKVISALQGIQEAHKDDDDGGQAAVAAALPAYAAAARLSPEDTAELRGHITADPAALDALDRMYNGNETYNQAAQLATDGKGHYKLVQIGTHGGQHEVDAGDGWSFLPPAPTITNTGGADVVTDRFGHVTKVLPRTVNPDVVAREAGEDRRTAMNIAGRADVQAAKNAGKNGKNGDDAYGAYDAARTSVVGMINGVKDLIADPNLNAATGYLSGAVDTPARQRIEGKIKALEGQAVPVAVAILKANGVQRPAQKEVTATAQGLLSDLQLLRQSTGDFKDRAAASMARLQQRVSQLDGSARRTGLIGNPIPAAPAPRRPVLPAPPGARPSPSQPVIRNW